MINGVRISHTLFKPTPRKKMERKRLKTRTENVVEIIVKKTLENKVTKTSFLRLVLK